MATEEEREALFGAIQEAVDNVVSMVVEGHYDALTQEPQLTAKIAGAIELTLDQMDLGDLNVKVTVRDFPPQGPGALEGKVGADVYISVAVIGEDRNDVSKGMLAQAKWDHTIKDAKLPEQIGKMMERTESSYVWVFGPHGVTGLPGGTYFDPNPAEEAGQSVGSLIANGLRCKEGDRRIGRDLTKPLITSLNEIMQDLGVNTAVSFTIREGSRRLRFYRRRRRKR
jgi:hypothetical protein